MGFKIDFNSTNYGIMTRTWPMVLLKHVVNYIIKEVVVYFLASITRVDIANLPRNCYFVRNSIVATFVVAGFAIIIAKWILGSVHFIVIIKNSYQYHSTNSSYVGFFINQTLQSNYPIPSWH